jgi:hypothetical protein
VDYVCLTNLRPECTSFDSYRTAGTAESGKGSNMSERHDSQIGRDKGSHELIVRIRQPGQNSHNRTARTAKSEQDSQDCIIRRRSLKSIVRAVQPGRHSQDRTAPHCQCRTVFWSPYPHRMFRDFLLVTFVLEDKLIQNCQSDLNCAVNVSKGFTFSWSLRRS